MSSNQFDGFGPLGSLGTVLFCSVFVVAGLAVMVVFGELATLIPIGFEFDTNESRLLNPCYD